MGKVKLVVGQGGLGQAKKILNWVLGGISKYSGGQGSFKNIKLGVRGEVNVKRVISQGGLEVKGKLKNMGRV